MADITPKSQLKEWWQTGSKPNQAQYYLWMDAYWHKSEAIAMSNISGLGNALEGKADEDRLQYYAKADATNIDAVLWRNVLGVNAVDLSNYYTKDQVNGLINGVTVDLSNYHTIAQYQAWVSTATAPATQTEVEAATGTESQPLSTEPATETKKYLSLFNFFKLIKKLRYIHLLPNSATAVANRFWSNGVRLFYADNSAVARTVAYTTDLPTTFVYTPTGNFTTSQMKTAAEAAGLIFNGLHFIINIGTNNFTLTIDNGASNPTVIITCGKRGTTGSISFASSRTLNSGIDAITLLNGNENSMALLNFGTSQDLLTIKNQ